MYSVAKANIRLRQSKYFWGDQATGCLHIHIFKLIAVLSVRYVVGGKIWKVAGE